MEIWFQDEARIGQQGTLTRIWAKQGSRPRAPRDLRHEWAYIFGAVCPARCATAALVLPYADAEAFSLHLAAIGKEVARGAHATPHPRRRWIPRRCGSQDARQHHPAALAVLFARTQSDRERWEYLRKNKLAITVYHDYENIIAKRCEAGNFFAYDRAAIASITSRQWAQVNL